MVSKPPPADTPATSKPAIELAIQATRDADGRWYWWATAGDRKPIEGTATGESTADSRIGRGLNAIAQATGW